MGKRTKDGKFTSEYLKGNKFALGNKPNKTSFKKGENFMENHPSWKGGIQNNKKKRSCKEFRKREKNFDGSLCVGTNLS